MNKLQTTTTAQTQRSLITRINKNPFFFAVSNYPFERKHLLFFFVHLFFSKLFCF
jgi:hypothetical protein